MHAYAQVWGKTGSKLYGADSGADYVDNHKRFSMFCKAAVEAARVSGALLCVWVCVCVCGCGAVQASYLNHR